MKKTIKLLGLLFVAAMLFAGCANGSSSSDSTPNINEALFSADDVTVAATKYELADGKWIYRAVGKSDIDANSEHFEFTLKNGKVDTSADADKKYITSTSGTLPANADEATIAAAKAQGYTIDGNKYTYTKEYDKAAINKLFEKAAANPSATSGKVTDPDMVAYIKIKSAIEKANYMNNSSTPTGCKTNAEKTKYLWTKEYTTYSTSGTTAKGTGTYYLIKK